MNKRKKAITLLAIFSFLLFNLAPTSVMVHAQAQPTVSSTTHGSQRGPSNGTFDRGVCGDFKGKTYDRYCKKPKPTPNRPVTKQEIKCLLSLGVSVLSIWGGPVSWQTVVASFGSGVLGCAF